MVTVVPRTVDRLMAVLAVTEGGAVNTSLSAESVFQLTSTSGLAPPFLQVSVKVLAVAAPSVKVATLPVSAAVEAQV